MSRKPAEDKPADLRIVLPADLAQTLRERAATGRRTMQAQALVEIERGIALVDEIGPSTRGKA